jgi:HAD superfamily hydrolase (TIGR01450 family)
MEAIVKSNVAIDALAKARGWIFDVDGTLMRSARPGGAGGKAIDGAADLIDKLRSQGRKVLVCTQASNITPRECAAGLAAAGLPVAENDMITAGFAAALILKDKFPGGRILALGESGLTAPLQNAGLNLAESGNPEKIDAVMVGHARAYEAWWIDSACRAIEAGAEFYTTTDDFWFNGGLGSFVAPTAAIAAAIEAVIGVRATVIGKPSALLGCVLLQKLCLEGHEVVVVDDTIPHGIQLAHNMGAHSVMPLTGTSTRDDAERSPEKPTLICDSVNDLRQLI